MAQEDWEKAITGGVIGWGAGFFRFIGEFVLLLFSAVKSIRGLFKEWKETVGQMAFIGYNSVPIVFVTTMFSGAVISLYSASLLMRYGVGSLTGSAVGLSMTREIGPVMAGIMVAARCGSAMSAQIGSMKVSEQIDALRALAVDPIQYLVLPRLIASVTMLPILGLLGMYTGVLGGLGVAYLLGVPTQAFLLSLQDFVQPSDVIGGMIKTVVFGVIISIVGCQQGLAAKQGAVGVGKATTSSVVISMVLIYIANYFLAYFLFERGAP